MNLNQLRKAAKHYSADTSIPLADAQEKLSKYFGFRNFEAARKALNIATPKSLAAVDLPENSKPEIFRPGIYVLHGMMGTGKTWLIENVLKTTSMRSEFLPNPIRGERFAAQIDWTLLDCVVIDEIGGYDQHSLREGLSILQQETLEKRTILLLIAQSMDQIRSLQISNTSVHIDKAKSNLLDAYLAGNQKPTDPLLALFSTASTSPFETHKNLRSDQSNGALPIIGAPLL